MIYRWLADAMVAIHVGYVLFVVLGLLAIWVGRALGWQWLHNRWFRSIHFLMIAIVAFEAIAGLECPLTTWEGSLRALGGEATTDTSFVGRMLHSLLFLNLPEWAFNVMHVGFAFLVLATFWIAPVNWRPEKDDPPPALAQGKM
jgi:hypothetical protein